MAKLQFIVEIEFDREPRNAGEAQKLCAIIEDVLIEPLHDTDCRATNIICLHPNTIK